MDENAQLAVEEVEISGHIIDNLTLPRVLDLITQSGGSFNVKSFVIGQRKSDLSRALIEVQADTRDNLDVILGQIGDLGAVPTSQEDCHLTLADMDGAFPEGFYSTTNQRTQVRIHGQWVDVEDQEMDCGVVVKTDEPSARCIPMTAVETGMQLIVGHAGVRVFPPQRDRDHPAWCPPNDGTPRCSARDGPRP